MTSRLCTTFRCQGGASMRMRKALKKQIWAIIRILAQLIALSPLTINGPNTQRDTAELTPTCEFALLCNRRLKSSGQSASCLNQEMTRRSFLRRVHTSDHRLYCVWYGCMLRCRLRIYVHVSSKYNHMFSFFPPRDSQYCVLYVTDNTFTWCNGM